MTCRLWFLAGLSCMAHAVAQTAWSQHLPPNFPSARRSFGLAQDANFDVLLFGGIVASGQALGDTWVWDGAGWTERFPTPAPPARAGHGMVADLWRNRVVLFGGRLATSVLASDTWEWDGTNWIQRLAASPPIARSDLSMAFDVARGRTVMFGGVTPTGMLSDTWEWDGTQWTLRVLPNAPSFRCCAPMCYDQVRRRTVLFGGTAGGALFADTWEYDGTNWVARTPVISPPARCCSALAYDAHRQRTVLFGGAASIGYGEFADTWEWNGTAWQLRTTASAPLGRRSPGMVHDIARQRLWLFGGHIYSSSWFRDTWSYAAVTPASATAFGAGCTGTAGVPILFASAAPWVGDTLLLEARAVPAGSPALAALSLSDTHWNTTALPMSLSGLGMPGCALLVGEGPVVPMASAGAGVQLGIAIPASTVLAGLAVFVQAFVADPPANPAGFTATNAVELRIGAR